MTILNFFIKCKPHLLITINTKKSEQTNKKIQSIRFKGKFLKRLFGAVKHNFCTKKNKKQKTGVLNKKQ